MKKFAILTVIVIITLSLTSIAGAEQYTFRPDDGYGDPDDLWDLDHGHAYSWGVDWAVPTGETIVGASLSFDNIRNWTTEENDLWVHLLDEVTPGAHQYNDPVSGQVDYFDGEGVLLNRWQDLPATAQDITYTFTPEDILVLSSYIEDGNFGLGFDPDCHFYNDGIALTVETAIIPPVSAVPEPGTVLLMGAGLLALVGIRRKHINK